MHLENLPIIMGKATETKLTSDSNYLFVTSLGSTKKDDSKLPRKVKYSQIFRSFF